MAQFHYEWWTVEIHESTGWITLEIKAKNKEGAIRQIERLVAKSNSPENLAKPWYKQITPISEVRWESLHLDRTGYQRLY